MQHQDQLKDTDYASKFDKHHHHNDIHSPHVMHSPNSKFHNLHASFHIPSLDQEQPQMEMVKSVETISNNKGRIATIGLSNDYSIMYDPHQDVDQENIRLKNAFVRHQDNISKWDTTIKEIQQKRQKMAKLDY